jgi:pimeloyl-ACP methyl ester carboxylesterase
LPPISESRSLAGSLGREYWIRFPSPAEAEGVAPAMAHVYEPAKGPVRGTVLAAHGLGLEVDWTRATRYPVARFCAAGFRFILLEGPWHGSRSTPETALGEPILAEAPAGLLTYFDAHVRELGIITAWARGRENRPVGWMGESLGAYAAAIAAAASCNWPEAARPDAFLLQALTDALDGAVLDGVLADAYGVGAALRSAGWTDETIAQLRPLTGPAGPPATDPERILLLLGSEDRVTPFAGGCALAQKWGVPAENVFVRPQGHFSLPIGVHSDPEPIVRLMTLLEGR